MTIQLPGLQATLQGGAHNGQVDHVSINSHTDTVGYQAGAASPFSGSLLSAPGARAAAAGSGTGLSDRVVQFQTSNGRGGSDTLAFPGASQFVLSHTGSPAALALKLSAFTAQGLPIAVQLPAIRLSSGEKLRVAPATWRALGSAPIRVITSVHGRTIVRRVRGRLIGGRFATVTRARLVSLGGGRYGLRLALSVRQAPSGASLGVVASLMQGRHQLQRAVPVEAHGTHAAQRHCPADPPGPAGSRGAPRGDPPARDDAGGVGSGLGAGDARPQRSRRLTYSSSARASSRREPMPSLR